MSRSLLRGRAQLVQQGCFVRGTHQVLSDEQGVAPSGGQGCHLLGAGNTAFSHKQDLSGYQAFEAGAVACIHGEVMQIAIVHTDNAGADLERARNLSFIVGLH